MLVGDRSLKVGRRPPDRPRNRPIYLKRPHRTDLSFGILEDDQRNGTSARVDSGGKRGMEERAREVRAAGPEAVPGGQHRVVDGVHQDHSCMGDGPGMASRHGLNIGGAEHV